MGRAKIMILAIFRMISRVILASKYANIVKGVGLDWLPSILRGHWTQQVLEDPPPKSSPNLCRNLMESFGVDTPINIDFMSVLMDEEKIRNIVGPETTFFELRKFFVQIFRVPTFEGILRM